MSRTSLFFVCGFALLCGTGCVKSDGGSAETAERSSLLYRQAFSAEQSGDIEEAVRLYNKVLLEEPKSFSAHFQLATLLHDHKEDYVGAIYHYNQYLYFRPASDKSTLAQERVRIAEQLLAPQILRKVGDSVQGISQAHLLKENDRLNRLITSLEGEKSVLTEAKTRIEKELETACSENARLHQILGKMRTDEAAAQPSASLLKRVESAVRKGGDEEAPAAGGRPDAKTLRALREEAAATAEDSGVKDAGRKALVEVPSTEEVLKKVQTRLTGSPGASVAAQEKPVKTEKADKSSLSSLLPFGKDDKKDKAAKAGAEPRTYVVQPGDSLFRVAEKFYGDSTHWKKIRDANRTRIDPDGRIRAGQIIVVP